MTCVRHDALVVTRGTTTKASRKTVVPHSEAARAMIVDSCHRIPEATIHDLVEEG
jgi:hypothetical protein